MFVIMFCVCAQENYSHSAVSSSSTIAILLLDNSSELVDMSLLKQIRETQNNSSPFSLPQRAKRTMAIQSTISIFIMIFSLARRFFYCCKFCCFPIFSGQIIFGLNEVVAGAFVCLASFAIVFIF